MKNTPAPFTERQTAYFFRSLHSWFNVAEGGKRGAKNVLQTMAFCARLERHPDRYHLIAGVSSASALINIVDCDGYGMINFFGEGKCRHGKYNNRDAVIVQTVTGQKIVFVSGGRKLGDEKAIKGNTYGLAYITEANECHPNFIKEVFDRTMSSSDRGIYHDLNPKSERHPYYTDILDFHQSQQAQHPDYGFNYGHFTIADNLSISDERLREILSTYERGTVWYQRDILGLRRATEGLVYPMFDPKRHIVQAGNPVGRYFISVDYGTQNPTAFGLWCLKGDSAVMVKEYYYDGRRTKRQKTDEEYYSDLVDFAGNRRIEKVIIDPSAASFKVLIRQRGRFSVLNANNDVINGIRTVATLLGAGKIAFDESCTNTFDEFGIYSWDDKSTEDRVIKDFDHSLDQCRYFCHTIMWRDV